MRYREIIRSDVGKTTLRIGEINYLVSDFMGRILPDDVGKRIYFNNGIPQVENDHQRIDRENASRELNIFKESLVTQQRYLAAAVKKLDDPWNLEDIEASKIEKEKTAAEISKWMQAETITKQIINEW